MKMNTPAILFLATLISSCWGQLYVHQTAASYSTCGNEIVQEEYTLDGACLEGDGSNYRRVCSQEDNTVVEYSSCDDTCNSCGVTKTYQQGDCNTLGLTLRCVQNPTFLIKQGFHGAYTYKNGTNCEDSPIEFWMEKDSCSKDPGHKWSNGVYCQDGQFYMAEKCFEDKCQGCIVLMKGNMKCSHDILNVCP